MLTDMRAILDPPRQVVEDEFMPLYHEPVRSKFQLQACCE
jgi:hypothetical protein